MIKQDGPKKNRMKNFHKMTLKMILFASPMEREMVPDEPVFHELQVSCTHRARIE
jgi:hypothetical protein